MDNWKDKCPMEDDIPRESSSVLQDKRAVPRNAIELQKLLIDERIRCETHKTNYQTLKEEHTRLQNEHMKFQEELSNLHRTKRLVMNEQEKKDEMIQVLKRRLEMKHQELEVTKTQVVDPQKLEAIKGEISRELEGPIKEYMISMDKDVEKYRTDYNKMRYQYTILKTEFEHSQQNAKRELDEHGLRLQTEISALKYERDELAERLKESPDTKESDLLQLKKIKTHLEQRVHVLEEELEEERKIKENKNRETTAMQQTQAQDLIKIESNLKSLEMEKRSVEHQCERYKKELTGTYERISTLSRDLQEASKQSVFLRGELEECEHKLKLQEAGYKMESLKMKGDYQRENESLHNRIRELETELELAKSTNEEHNNELQRLENQTSSRIQDEIRCEWEKNNVLTNEKSVLEQKVEDFERRFAEERSFAKEQTEKLTEELRINENCNSGLKKELEKLKERLREEENRNAQFKREIDDLSHMRQKLRERDMEFNNVNNSRKSTAEELEKTKSKLASLRCEMEQVTQKAEHERCEFKSLLDNCAGSALEEKQKLQQRVEQLESKMRKSEDTTKSLRQQHKRVKTACLKKLKTLSNDLEINKAEKDKLEVELKAGVHGVSNEEHNRLKRKLREMERRLREFQRCLSDNNQNQLDYVPMKQQQPCDTINRSFEPFSFMPDWSDGYCKPRDNRPRQDSVTRATQQYYMAVEADRREKSFQHQQCKKKNFACRTIGRYHQILANKAASIKNKKKKECRKSASSAKFEPRFSTSSSSSIYKSPPSRCNSEPLVEDKNQFESNVLYHWSAVSSREDNRSFSAYEPVGVGSVLSNFGEPFKRSNSSIGRMLVRYNEPLDSSSSELLELIHKINRFCDESKIRQEETKEKMCCIASDRTESECKRSVCSEKDCELPEQCQEKLRFTETGRPPWGSANRNATPAKQYDLKTTTSYNTPVRNPSTISFLPFIRQPPNKSSDDQKPTSSQYKNASQPPQLRQNSFDWNMFMKFQSMEQQSILNFSEYKPLFHSTPNAKKIPEEPEGGCLDVTPLDSCKPTSPCLSNTPLEDYNHMWIPDKEPKCECLDLDTTPLDSSNPTSPCLSNTPLEDYNRMRTPTSSSGFQTAPQEFQFTRPHKDSCAEPKSPCDSKSSNNMRSSRSTMLHAERSCSSQASSYTKPDVAKSRRRGRPKTRRIMRKEQGDRTCLNTRKATRSRSRSRISCSGSKGLEDRVWTSKSTSVQNE